MSNIFFTSDSHHGHNAIIKYCDRPFKDVADQNEQLIKNWNSKCDKDSTIYHLGDFALGANAFALDEIINQLNFKKLIVIKGNHEKSFSNWYATHGKKRGDIVFKDYLEQRIDGVKFVFFHYPIASWNGKFHGSVMIHGHCHAHYEPGLPDNASNGKILDVGVDVHNYAPVSLDEVKKIMGFKHPESLDYTIG